MTKPAIVVLFFLVTAEARAADSALPAEKASTKEGGYRVACRPSTIPEQCHPTGGNLSWYPQNDAGLEGPGLETLHFKVADNKGANFPPAPGTLLHSTPVCSDHPPPAVSVRIGECTHEARGMATCSVDVVKGGVICQVRRFGNDRRGRGVTVVRGFWDGRGQFHDDGKSLTLSCDAGAAGPQSPHADGALTSCLQRGYLPDTHRKELLACIRAFRADYCGDGQPHTLSGTLLKIHDLTINKMTPDQCGDLGLTFEASWSEEGAVCLSHERWKGTSMKAECPFGPPDAKGVRCRAVSSPPLVFTRTECNTCPRNPDAGATCPGPDADPVCQPH